MFAHVDRPGQADQGDKHAVPANLGAVTDYHGVAEIGAGSDPRLAQRGPIRCGRLNFELIFILRHPRNLLMKPFSNVAA